tara:strand:- start:227 stop:499 length:273 start_codon:yes stop_codon:yes gene_type:complete
MKQALDALMVSTMQPGKDQILLFNVFYGHKDDFTPDMPECWKFPLDCIDPDLYKQGVVFDALLYDVLEGGYDKELNDIKRFTISDLNRPY